MWLEWLRSPSRAHTSPRQPPEPPSLSLGVVRKTFEDCRTVRSILRGFHVPIDERDLSMDAGYLDEIQMITASKKVRLPAVFLGGNYVGGAEEIKEMNESGELSKLIGGLPFCNGSHKIYSEKHGFRTCTSYCAGPKPMLQVLNPCFSE
uniref:Glutaredoxin domain-containing protein n=1 Tax=Manihot esculenta TaxID=3983 RepID=A0A2C9VNK9_MANES